MTIMIGDMAFDVEAIKDNRENLIKLRDEALKQSDFTWSVILSHTIALLANLIEREEASETRN